MDWCLNDGCMDGDGATCTHCVYMYTYWRHFRTDDGRTIFQDLAIDELTAEAAVLVTVPCDQLMETSLILSSTASCPYN